MCFLVICLPWLGLASSQIKIFQCVLVSHKWKLGKFKQSFQVKNLPEDNCNNEVCVQWTMTTLLSSLFHKQNEQMFGTS